jgi:WD40 repeat protein
MQLQESIMQKELKKTMIEFFFGIKKNNYELLPGDISKGLIDKPAMQLLLPNNQPWHYIEQVISDDSLLLSFVDDNRLVSLDTTEVKYFDLTTKKITHQVRYNTFSHDKICLNKSGKQFGMISRNQVRIFDIEQSKSLIDIHCNYPYETEKTVALCLSYDGTCLVCISDWKSLLIFDVISGKEIKRTHFKSKSYYEAIYHLCIDNLNQKIVISTEDHIIISSVLANGDIEYEVTIPHEKTASLCFDQSGGILAAAFYDGLISMFDATTGQCLYSLFFDEWTRTLCFDKNNKRLVVGSGERYLERSIRVINQYNNFTLEQLMLRKIMNIWLQVKKPNRGIDSEKKLLKNIAQLFFLDGKELHRVWKSFPSFMRTVIKKGMLKRIQKHGKVARIKSYTKQKIVQFRDALKD